MCKSLNVQSFTDVGSRLSTWAWACVLRRVLCAAWVRECCVRPCVYVWVLHVACMHACMGLTPCHWHVHISSFLCSLHMVILPLFPNTPSFPVYKAYLKILVFPFYKAQFGCFRSHVQIPRCIKSLHASIKRKLTNACTLSMHALQLMHW